MFREIWICARLILLANFTRTFTRGKSLFSSSVFCFERYNFVAGCFAVGNAVPGLGLSAYVLAKELSRSPERSRPTPSGWRGVTLCDS